MTENDFVKSWHKAMDYALNTLESNDERYYVADNNGLVMLDDTDFETAYVYANKIDGCTAFRKIK